jgi:hypothetical protein
MAQPLSSAGETYRDYGTPGEKSSFEITVVDLTAVNVAAQVGLLSTLWGTIDAMVLGNIASRKVVFAQSAPDDTVVTDPTAQRENKWLVRYHDTSGRKFRVELPTANLTLLDTGSEFLDLTGTEAAAFKTAFEAVAKSPDDQSTVVVDSIQFVGRRT